MLKFTIPFCLLVLAGCTHSDNPPAASANDEPPPKEVYETHYGPGPAPSRSSEYDLGTTAQTPTGAPGPLEDFDSSATDPDRTKTKPAAGSNEASQRGGGAVKATTGAAVAPTPSTGATGATDSTMSGAYPASLAPMENSANDVKITEELRQSVMNDGSLSFNARNIEIVTKQGKVTLRGQVNNAQERATLETKAMRIAGTGHVDNQLAVQP